MAGMPESVPVLPDAATTDSHSPGISGPFSGSHKFKAMALAMSGLRALQHLLDVWQPLHKSLHQESAQLFLAFLPVQI